MVYATDNDEVATYVGTTSPVTVTATELITLGVLPVTLLLLADLRPGDVVHAFFPETGVPHDAWALAIEAVGGSSVTLWADVVVPCHHLTLPFGPTGLKAFTSVEPVVPVLGGPPLASRPDPNSLTPARPSPLKHSPRFCLSWDKTGPPAGAAALLRRAR